MTMIAAILNPLFYAALAVTWETTATRYFRVPVSISDSLWKNGGWLLIRKDLEGW